MQLIWLALSALPADRLVKPVYVISTDTLVENPIVALWVSKSLETMQASAQKQGLPLTAHRLTPEIENTFWVNLIGRGYPAPPAQIPMVYGTTQDYAFNALYPFGRPAARRGPPSSSLALGRQKVRLGLGSWKPTKGSESVTDSAPTGICPIPSSTHPLKTGATTMSGSSLCRYPTLGVTENKDLLTMYQGASDDGECPLVVDTTTPSCGDSRFGCWVCTLVEKDKSMQAMIQNDDEKQWMLPLLELRNRLDPPKTPDGDRALRDFRRMNGTVQLFRDRPIPGPYTQEARESWLRQVLRAQRHIRAHGPEPVRELDLITLSELDAIRRIWVVDKHEIEDSLPRIYEEATGEAYPGPRLDDNTVLGAEEVGLLRELCGNDRLHFQLVRELLSTERRHKTMLRRTGIFNAFEQAFMRSFFTGEDDAVDRARQRRDALTAAREPVFGLNVEPIRESEESNPEEAL